MAEEQDKKQSNNLATEEAKDTISTNVSQKFAIQKIYIKNVSLESPNAPEIFLQEFKPELNVDLNIESKLLEEGLFHVEIRVTATTKVEGKVAFLCEVEQAGIFVLSGFDKPSLQYMLAAHCPNVLFPYAREVVSGLVDKAGFPQLLLEPVNFDAMYANRMQEARQQAQPQQ